MTSKRNEKKKGRGRSVGRSVGYRRMKWMTNNSPLVFELTSHRRDRVGGEGARYIQRSRGAN
jgi:hypothetical protein